MSPVSKILILELKLWWARRSHVASEIIHVALLGVIANLLLGDRAPFPLEWIVVLALIMTLRLTTLSWRQGQTQGVAPSLVVSPHFAVFLALRLGVNGIVISSLVWVLLHIALTSFNLIAWATNLQIFLCVTGFTLCFNLAAGLACDTQHNNQTSFLLALPLLLPHVFYLISLLRDEKNLSEGILVSINVLEVFIVFTILYQRFVPSKKA